MAEVLALEPLFERLSAREKKYQEVVVLVHHYGGHRHSFKRHADWLNDLGFDVVTFDLPFRRFTELSKRLPLSQSWRLGIRHIWQDKIEAVLGQLKEKKFLLSFSMPSAAALAAIANRHAVDVVGCICEGGPFLHLPLAQEKLLQFYIFKDRPRLARNPFLLSVLGRLTGLAMGESRFVEDSTQTLHQLPKGFPILSLRGGRDVLVAPNMIDDFFFLGLRQIDFERVLFENAEHLTAFRDNPDLYKKIVGGFLIRHATRLITSA